MIGFGAVSSGPQMDGVAESKSSADEEFGVWSHVLPYFAFLLLVQTRGMGSGYTEAICGVLEAAIPLAIIAYYYCRNAYPELRGPFSISPLLLFDVILGVLSGVAWMLPYLLFPLLQPVESPGLNGPQSTMSDWLSRGVTVVVAVPLLEELFIRSFVMRWAEAWGTEKGFRAVPIAKYTLRSFLVTVLIFTTAHQTWEWWVAVPWIIATNLWFYYRKNLFAVILVHAFANLTLLLAVAVADSYLTNADGESIRLWFLI